MAGVGATYGPGSPLKIGQEYIWRGRDKTNGFLMRNVDGRVPALKQSFSRLEIAPASVLASAGAVPYGNALWRDISSMDTEPGVVYCGKPPVGVFVGVMEFNQGIQTGHPVQGWGVAQFMRADMINKGYVGYKSAMTAVGQEDAYIAYLSRGSVNPSNVAEAVYDSDATRTFYSDWLTAYAAGGDGAKLGIFFDNTCGFPIVSVVAAAAQANPTLAGATFGGFVEIFEPENETVFLTLGY